MKQLLCTALLFAAACSSSSNSTKPPAGTGGSSPPATGGTGGAPSTPSTGGSGGVPSTGGSPAPDAAAGGTTSGTPDAASSPVEAGPPGSAPLLGILGLFTAADVPARGPNEADPIPHKWPTPTVMPTLPGNGLAQHPMLYAGEGYNVVFVVNEGKVIWSYTLGSPGEIDDVWMLSNGHVLVAFDQSVVEITPKKEVAWKYVPEGANQVHTCQPIGLDRVLFVENALPPRVRIINKTNNAVELDQPLTAPMNANPGGIHTQFRRFRMTGAGTYLASFLEINVVAEYDKDFKLIWSYPIAKPWASTRLANGNTLITSESTRTVREVNTNSETVWEFKQSDLPAGIIQQNTQSSERLANGNTVIFSSRSPTDPARPNIQAVEVTPDKKVVWILQDWKNLGQATTAQFLDQPGIPEKPGDLQH